MKFLLSIYGNDEVWSSLPPEAFGELVAATDAHNQAMIESGELLFAAGPADQDQIRKVTTEAGAPVVTDGPYIETKEWLGSFYIVDCVSMERALELAAGMPSAKFRQIEVWPLQHGGTPDDL